MTAARGKDASRLRPGHQRGDPYGDLPLPSVRVPRGVRPRRRRGRRPAPGWFWLYLGLAAAAVLRALAGR